MYKFILKLYEYHSAAVATQIHHRSSRSSISFLFVGLCFVCVSIVHIRCQTERQYLRHRRPDIRLPVLQTPQPKPFLQSDQIRRPTQSARSSSPFVVFYFRNAGLHLKIQRFRAGSVQPLWSGLFSLVRFSVGLIFLFFSFAIYLCVMSRNMVCVNMYCLNYPTLLPCPLDS